MAPHFTPELEAVIASALAKEKIERPNSAGELYSRVVYACSQQIPDAHRALLEDFEEDRTVRVDKSMIRDVIWKQTAHKTSGEPTDTPSGISYLQTALNTDSSTAYLNNNPSLSHAQTEEDDELGHTKLDNFHNYLADADSPPAFVIPDVRSFPITTPAQASYPPPPPLGLALPLLKDEEPTTLNPSTQTDRKHTTNQNYRSTDSPRPLSSPPIDILDARFHNPKNDSTQPQNTLPFQSQPKSNKRRWKTILLLILTLVLLGELLFVGWRLWQKYKTKPQPTPTSQNYHLQTNRHYDCSIDIKNNTQLTTAQIQHSRIQPIIAVLCNNGSLYALNLPSYPAQNHALIKNSASKHTVLG
jgi:hypothetical protein